MKRLATSLSKIEIWLAVGFSAILGALLSAFVTELDSRGVSPVAVIQVSLALALVVFASSLIARHLSTDYGLCLVAWEAHIPFKERMSLTRALRSATREWEPFELDLPTRSEGLSKWIADFESILLNACDSGLRAPIGRPRLAFVPATRDHYAFLLGQALRPRLSGVMIEVWGRSRTSADHKSVQWGPMFHLGPKQHAALFSVPDPDASARGRANIGLGTGGLRGVQVLSGRRLPPEYRDVDGKPALERYRRDQIDGYVLIAIPEGPKGPPDSHDIVVAARLLRSYAREYVSIHGAGPVPLRLLCGEAEAFSLGLLAAQHCEFEIELWVRGTGWQRWFTTGGENGLVSAH